MTARATPELFARATVDESRAPSDFDARPASAG